MNNAASTPQECMSSFIEAMIARDMVAALSLLTEDVVLFIATAVRCGGRRRSLRP